MLATATSERAGVQRWTELVVYRLRDGSYILSKVGRTTIAHRPECERVTRWMVTWLEAGEEAKVHRYPCVECMPVVGDGMDPHTVLEATRYTALWAHSPDELVSLLLQGRPGQPEQHPGHLNGVVARIVDQLVDVDPPFAGQWEKIRDTR